jgi:hypothetical protein
MMKLHNILPSRDTKQSEVSRMVTSLPGQDKRATAFRNTNLVGA